MDFEKYIDSDLLDKFEFFNYGHALEILHDAFPNEWKELQDCFRHLKLSLSDIRKAGGNESPKGYIDGHNIDFLKNRVAFDLEWNSKDQTFDRDLLAMRTYFDCGLIDVGVIVTRAEELNEIFRTEKDNNGQKLINKYGASTTWIGKLLYRLDSRRNGGCPILAVGIKKGCVEEYGNSTEHNSKLI